MNAVMAEAYVSVAWHGVSLVLFSFRVLASPGKSWIFLKISRTWKVVGNEFGHGKYRKFKFNGPGKCWNLSAVQLNQHVF